MNGKFKEMTEKFPGWLDRLQKSPSFTRDEIKKMPNQGIYVFYDEKNRPLYVGRSDRMRTHLFEHSRPGSGNTSGTFAFILATEKLKKTETGNTKSRNNVELEKDFSEKYEQAKADVAKMRIRVTEILEPAERALFEIYAALELNTPYNAWETY